MLSFTDEEMNSITALASALPLGARDDFLQLAAHPPQARGPGLVYRIAVEAQQVFLRRNSVAIGKSKPQSQPMRRGRRW